MLLLMSVQEEEWDEVDLAIRQFQGMTQAIKFSPKPVVIAPFGMTLGGGAEIILARPGTPAASPNSTSDWSRSGSACCPGGGGCKEMLLRAVDHAAALRKGARSRGPGRIRRTDGSNEEGL